LLDKEGATDLVVDLIIENYCNRIFGETVELGIALLDGGNCAIQVCFILHLCCLLLHAGDSFFCKCSVCLEFRNFLSDLLSLTE